MHNMIIIFSNAIYVELIRFPLVFPIVMGLLMDCDFDARDNGSAYAEAEAAL